MKNSQCEQFELNEESDDIEKLLLKVTQLSLSTALSDSAWKLFGYSRRPTYGKFVQKFRPKWKVEIERKLFRELIISHIAAHVLAGVISIKTVEQVVNYFVEFFYVKNGCGLDCLGYASQKEAERDMYSTVLGYAKTPLESWGGMLMDRISVNLVPKNKESMEIIAGCIKFSQVAQLIIRQIKIQQND
jgi:hypothetical protein